MFLKKNSIIGIHRHGHEQGAVFIEVTLILVLIVGVCFAGINLFGDYIYSPGSHSIIAAIGDSMGNALGVPPPSDEFIFDGKLFGNPCMAKKYYAPAVAAINSPSFPKLAIPIRVYDEATWYANLEADKAAYDDWVGAADTWSKANPQAAFDPWAVQVAMDTTLFPYGSATPEAPGPDSSGGLTTADPGNLKVDYSNCFTDFGTAVGNLHDGPTPEDC